VRFINQRVNPQTAAEDDVALASSASTAVLCCANHEQMRSGPTLGTKLHITDVHKPCLIWSLIFRAHYWGNPKPMHGGVGASTAQQCWYCCKRGCCGICLIASHAQLARTGLGRASHRHRLTAFLGHAPSPQIRPRPCWTAVHVPALTGSSQHRQQLPRPQGH